MLSIVVEAAPSVSELTLLRCSTICSVPRLQPQSKRNSQEFLDLAEINAIAAQILPTFVEIYGTSFLRILCHQWSTMSNTNAPTRSVEYR